MFPAGSYAVPISIIRWSALTGALSSAMSDSRSLESFQELHADLLALSESRISNIERLGIQLRAHIEEFRRLLDKKARSEQSRQVLEAGKLELQGESYTVSEQFKETVRKVADNLDLDQLDAAEIVLEAQDESEFSGQTLETCSIIRFHQRRKALLDCLRLVFSLSDDEDLDEGIRDWLHAFITEVTQLQGTSNDEKSFTQRCLTTMVDIKSWLQALTAKLSTLSMPARGQQTEETEVTGYQRVSLVKQHEILGVIVLHLEKQNRSSVADFESILGTLKRFDKYDNLLVHYFPALSAFISRFGGQDGGASNADARALNEKLFPQGEEDPWPLVYVHAAIRSWWLAEYSSWYGEHYDGSLAPNKLEDENKERSKQFAEALKDGAFDFILSLSADVKSSDWHDPARHGLRQWLQRKAPPLLSDSVNFSDFFQEALMEQLEAFIEAFITNMPDILRKLRLDEDEQRQLSATQDHDLDLERFIVTISYAYEGRPKAAADGFWGVPDGALMGFMHWASRRASTPLVSSFCEMLQAISEDEECATAAHQFLLDEGSLSSGKIRRPHSLTWVQIFKELTFFSSKIRDRPPVPQTHGSGKPNNDHAEMEPESLMMLECYLRLITRLCSASETARNFLVHHPSFHLTELLFQLASSSIEPRLKACAFTTLGSFLSQKTKEAGEYMWTALDVWISGGYSPGSSTSKNSAPTSLPTPTSSIERILRGLGTGFEEPNAFVQLLYILVLPYVEETGLHDGLPFPENLGVLSRMPGIEPYVDFALGQIFGGHTSELNDVVHMRLLRLTCLDFIATCLNTFNEDLVIFANKSNIMVDNAIQASSLKAYILLHPFGRVMEWLFNEKVMNALFATVHQDPTDIGSSAPDSPLMLCLLRGIQVITSILDLQRTYLDIVRPLVKLQSTHRRIPVSNASFSSFEDGILNHLSIVADLGLYCGAGQPELIIASLKLLEKLSASPRLASATGTGFGRRAERNKLIAALQFNNDSETISKSLLHEMKSIIDINQGPADSAYIIKLHILDFLAACLRTSPDQPTIGHLLLGFQCSSNFIEIESGSPFNRGISLFHTILEIAVETPFGEEVGTVSSWLVSLKCKALEVLSQLWKSPLSSALVMAEMRSYQSLFAMFVKQPVLSSETILDGTALGNPEFVLSHVSTCLPDFLCQRALTLQYVAAELRDAARSHLPSLKTRIFGTLQGSTTEDDGHKIENSTIFDMFDFLELDFGPQIQQPELLWYPDVDLDVCLEYDEKTSLSTYDLVKVRELLLLRRAELMKEHRLGDPQDIALVDGQSAELMEFCHVDNQFKLFWMSRQTLLRSWVQLMLVMTESGELVGPNKTSLVLRTLEAILPNLENRLENELESMELAGLAKSLIFSLEFDSESFRLGDMGDLVSDRLFHLFQVSLRAINSLGANPAIKEIFYNISYRYLTGMSDVTGISGVKRRHSVQTVKAAGDRFIDLVCEDAYGGEPSSRISALLHLDALVKMADQENSKYIIESLCRLNFISILVDSIQNFQRDLRETSREDMSLQLFYCNLKLALLLHISQSRFGAATVLNAGLFHSIKVSGLFATDPDLGIDIDDENAIIKHYELLTSLMRVICAAVLSRGSQNQHTLEQGRKFFTDNRLSILALFKKSAGIGTESDSSRQIIDELAELYILLMSITGFLDFEDTVQKRPGLKAFT